MKRKIIVAWVIALASLLIWFAGQAVTGPLAFGAKGNAVKALQQRLIDTGFLKGKADGIYGKGTQGAVMRLQQYLIGRGHALSANGTADEATQKLLLDDAAMAEFLDLKIGSSGRKVTDLQNRLYDLNFLAQPADGAFGKNTQQALRALQEVLVTRQAPGVTVNGVADQATRQALAGDLRAMGILAPEFYDSAKPQLLPPEYLWARAAILLDAQSGETLYEKLPNQRMYPASTTKIMALLLACEKGNLDRLVTIPKAASQAPKGSSLVPVYPGEKMSMRDLLYGLMVRSGNDAALAVAELVSGSQPAFVQAMNDKAAQLGLKNTRFANPHGFHDQAHYTTARDLAVLTRHALQNPDFAAIVSANSYTLAATSLRPALLIENNVGLFLPLSGQYCPGAYGVKSGYTRLAGACYVGAARRGGRELIAVALNCRGRDRSWQDMCRLFNYGYAKLGIAASQ